MLSYYYACYDAYRLLSRYGVYWQGSFCFLWEQKWLLLVFLNCWVLEAKSILVLSWNKYWFSLFFSLRKWIYCECYSCRWGKGSSGPHRLIKPVTQADVQEASSLPLGQHVHASSQQCLLGQRKGGFVVYLSIAVRLQACFFRVQK